MDLVVPLPAYVGNALHDFFSAFATLDDVKKDVVPAVEKALLRAPEVVLNDLVAPMIASLPNEFDLSDILVSNLLKPLLSNIESTNAVVREGALHAFEVIATQCHDGKLVEKAVDEILTPLKTNKVASADQRVIHAQMLSAFPPTMTTTTKVPQGMISVVNKEANEAVASAEIHTICKYVRYALEHDIRIEPTTTDAFSKGMAEKRLPIRRLWALRFADTMWSLSADALGKETACNFMDSSIGKLIDVFNEVIANPLPALQNGQVSVACAAAALCLDKTPKMPAFKSASIVKKASIADRVLTLEPKASFC